ncbi:MAG: hypothetical protein PQJ58_00435 [Spirochaetales bacterium]|nr:hypothetical protein [Spirochaetales bacterium]
MKKTESKPIYKYFRKKLLFTLLLIISLSSCREGLVDLKRANTSLALQLNLDEPASRYIYSGAETALITMTYPDETPVEYEYSLTPGNNQIILNELVPVDSLHISIALLSPDDSAPVSYGETTAEILPGDNYLEMELDKCFRVEIQNIGAYSLSPSLPYYPEGTEVILTFESDLPDHITYWINGTDKVENFTYSFTVDKNMQLVINYTSDRIVFFSNEEHFGSLPSDIHFNSGDSVTIPHRNDLEKRFHLFKGWNTKNDGSGKHYQPEDLIIIDEAFEADPVLSLYPIWEAVPPLMDADGVNNIHPVYSDAVVTASSWNTDFSRNDLAGYAFHYTSSPWQSVIDNSLYDSVKDVSAQHITLDYGQDSNLPIIRTLMLWGSNSPIGRMPGVIRVVGTNEVVDPLAADPVFVNETILLDWHEIIWTDNKKYREISFSNDQTYRYLRLEIAETSGFTGETPSTIVAILGIAYID